MGTFRRIWPWLYADDDAAAAENGGTESPPITRIRETTPGNGASATESGSANWREFGTADMGAALSSVAGNEYVTATLNGTSITKTQRIVARGFFHRVPARATISKIEVFLRLRSAAGAGIDTEVYLTKDGASPVSVNLAEEETIGTSFAQITRTDGGLAGTTWTPEEINADGFGVIVRISSTTADTIDMNGVRIAVYYHPPSPPLRGFVPMRGAERRWRGFR